MSIVSSRSGQEQRHPQGLQMATLEGPLCDMPRQGTCSGSRPSSSSRKEGSPPLVHQPVEIQVETVVRGRDGAKAILKRLRAPAMQLSEASAVYMLYNDGTNRHARHACVQVLFSVPPAAAAVASYLHSRVGRSEFWLKYDLTAQTSMTASGAGAEPSQTPVYSEVWSETDPLEHRDSYTLVRQGSPCGRWTRADIKETVRQLAGRDCIYRDGGVGCDSSCLEAHMLSHPETLELEINISGWRQREYNNCVTFAADLFSIIVNRQAPQLEKPESIQFGSSMGAQQEPH